jgi:hypothetical protein
MHLSIRNLKKDKGPGLIKSWAPAVLLESARPEQLPDSPTDMKSDRSEYGKACLTVHAGDLAR